MNLKLRPQPAHALDVLFRAGSKLGLLVGVLVIFGIGYFVGTGDEGDTPASHDSTTHTEATDWTCSMHPQIRQPKPGRCPICGMDLIPVVVGQASSEPLRTFTMPAGSAALNEIQTVRVERRMVEKPIRLTGKVSYDETRVARIAAYVPGRLERLFVSYTGQTVNKGEHMAEVFSPELLAAKEELRRAVKAAQSSDAAAADVVKKTAQNTLEAVRAKLRRWGLTDAQIRDAEQSGELTDRITIYAPIGGTVVSKNGVEGMYVEMGEPIYEIVDLEEVWVMLDAYESDIQWIRYGQDVRFTSDAYPGEVFEGRVSFVNPVLDPMTRTVKVRVNVPNKGGKLKPEMFVRGEIQALIGSRGLVYNPELAGKWISPMHPEVVRDEPGPCPVCGMPLVRAETLGYAGAGVDGDAPLIVPASAPLITGTRAVVYVSRSDAAEPTFEGREIVLGPRAGDFYVVNSGLNEGDLVVTSGNFKIDSALQILAKPSMMLPDAGVLGQTDVLAITTPAKREAAALLDGLDELADSASGQDQDRTRMLAASQRSDVESALNDVASLLRQPETIQVWSELAARLKNDVAALESTANIDTMNESGARLRDTMAAIRQRFGLDAEPAAPLDIPDAFVAQLQTAVDAYLAVEEPLASDDFENAKASLVPLQTAVGGIDMGLLTGDAHDAWMPLSETMARAITEMTQSTDIKAMRVPLKPLSGALIEAVSRFGLPAGYAVERMHCPMALGEGADWLQRDKDLRNPYYGARMLKCGDHVETFGKPAAHDHAEHAHEH